VNWTYTTLEETAVYRINDDGSSESHSVYATEIQEYVAEGGVIDPYVEPPQPKPVPTPEDQLLLNHENRIRSLEGQAPLSIEEFKAKQWA
jgi:hypothetical protein